MSKMNTSITTASHINGPQGITTFLSNVMVLVSVLAEVEKEVLDDEGEERDAPFLYEVCKQFFQKVTSLAFRRRFQEVYPTNRHIPYTITHWIDVISCMLFLGAKKTNNMRVVAKISGMGYPASSS